MESNNVERQVPDWQRQAWLTEYQALQDDINSLGSNHWLFASVFIGVSTVLFAGLLGGILLNNDLLSLLVSTGNDTSPKMFVLLTATVTGLTVLALLWLLRLALKRTTFLEQIDFERMRDIERDLGMWAHWRVHGVDHWTNNDFDDEIADEDMARLRLYQPPTYRPQEFWQRWRTGWWVRSTRWIDDGTFYAIMFLWLFAVLGLWFMTLVRTNPLALSLLAATGFALIISCLVIRFTRTGRRRRHLDH